MKPLIGHGFTLTEALLALLTAGVVTSSLCLSLEGALHLGRMEQDTQNELGILQMRQRAALASQANVDQGVLVLIRNHERYTWEADGGRVVQRPGYEILLEGMEGEFVQREKEIWLETKGKAWQIR